MVEKTKYNIIIMLDMNLIRNLYELTQKLSQNVYSMCKEGVECVNPLSPYLADTAYSLILVYSYLELKNI